VGFRLPSLPALLPLRLHLPHEGAESLLHATDQEIIRSFIIWSLPLPIIPMKHLFPNSLLAACFALSCASCGDPPELVEKRERQKAEIARLRGELALVEEKLRDMPPDVSNELESAKKKSAGQAAQITTMETEINSLLAHKRALQSEFDSYRAKYQLK
jgi:hypothetical protein